jgi:hypothetical protein
VDASGYVGRRLAARPESRGETVVAIGCAVAGLPLGAGAEGARPDSGAASAPPIVGPMSKRAVLVLRASAIWAVWVWAVLIRNMLIDHTHGWAFRAVHIGLAIVSLAFAVATWCIAGRASRAAKREASRTEPRVPAEHGSARSPTR